MNECPTCGQPMLTPARKVNESMNKYVWEDGSHLSTIMRSEPRFSAFKDIPQPDGTNQKLETKWVLASVYATELAKKKADEAALLATVRKPIVPAGQAPDKGALSNVVQPNAGANTPPINALPRAATPNVLPTPTEKVIEPLPADVGAGKHPSDLS